MRPECEPGRAAWPVFLRSCAVLMDRLDRQLQDQAGLPLSWYEVLHQLNSAGGRLPMHRLAESIMLSKSGVTRLVDRMGQAGLIERVSCSDDGRVCFAALTDGGRSAFAKAQPVASQGVEDNFARHLTEEEARTMAEALRRVLDATGSPAGTPNRSAK